MIQCPVCQSKELEGAFFCSECGAQFIQPGTLLHEEQVGEPDFQFSRIETHSEEEKRSQPMWLRILDNGEMIRLPDWDQITLGRVNEGQELLPDIDLTPYHAYELGVSRLHAMIVFQKNKPHLIDLSSANGVKVNGVRLTLKIPHELGNGDRIELGKLQLQVLIEN